MLSVNIKKSNLPLLDELNSVSSKKINIDIWLEWLVQISYKDRNFIDIIEKLIIDLFLTKIDKFGDVYDSFSLILEKLNKELKVLSKDYNLDWLNIFLWIVQNDTLHFSILWNYSIYLIKNYKIIDIADWMQWKNLEFSYISSWNVNLGDSIFLSNLNLLDYVSKDDIFEISKAEKIDKLEIIEQILSQEASSEQFNLISLSNISEIQIDNKNIAFDLIKSKFLSIKDKLIENEKVDSLLTKIKSKINLKNKYVYISLLSTWVLLAIILLYTIISSMLNSWMSSSVPEEYKSKLIEANLILQRTNKDIWNKDVFDANIKKAEDLIYAVRNEKLFINDVKKLLDYISILKKQASWIETFTVSKDKSEIEFSDSNFDVLWIFEFNKKYFYIWKNSIVWPYIKWWEQKYYKYPDWEEAVSADVSSDGDVYILTKSYRILQFIKQDFKYVNVEWQKTWEEATDIKTFNWNIYLLNDKNNQIYKHKPWINWFSPRSSLISDNISKNLSILDFAVDGWFYIIKKDLAIDKFFTAPEYDSRSIIINNIKNSNYTTSWDYVTKLFVAQNLNYLYLLLNNKVWIFEIDNRNYRDVKSLKYIWQLESSEWTIRSFYVPKDWIIYIWNDKWVYLVNFEISDNKVIVR